METKTATTSSVIPASEQKFKKDFTAWIYGEFQFGKKSILAYLPFLPALGTALYGYFKDKIEKSDFLKQYLEVEDLFTGSILIQVIFIFCILIYQVYFFSKTENDGLAKKLKDLLSRKEKKEIDALPEVVSRFTHTRSENNDSEKNWENLKLDLDSAQKNILYFKISWIVMWVNWFCYYIALYFDTDSAPLFDFFMVTETLCFAACYYRLTSHIFESRTKELRQYWWAVIMAALLFALAIADQAFQNTFAPLMVTSALKTIFGCTFLGLLIGVLTQSVFNAPNWLKILLFVYVALQVILFGVHEMPDITKKHFKETIHHIEKSRHENERIDNDSITSLINKNKILLTARIKNDSLPEAETGYVLGKATVVYEDSMRVIQVLEIIMFNLCLALKYLLMFYFIWLLRFDHLLVYFLRTQGDQEYIQKVRSDFDKAVDELSSPNNDELKQL
jgi:hypothetical protein